MRKPPKKIRIGPFTYRVRLNAQRAEDAQLDYGHYDAQHLEILINPALPEQVMREVVLHEVLHAVLDLQGIMHGPDIDKDTEELLVRGMSPLLLDVLRRNPKLATYLTAVD